MFAQMWGETIQNWPPACPECGTRHVRRSDTGWSACLDCAARFRLSRADWLSQEEVPWVVLVTYLLANGASIRQLPLLGIAYHIARQWAMVIRQRTGIDKLSEHKVLPRELSHLLDDARTTGALESPGFQKILCRVLWDVAAAPDETALPREGAARREPQTASLRDVRMRGFSHRHTVSQALRWLDAQVVPLSSEPLPLAFAAGRVLAETIESAVNVPDFDRSTMDGFAVVASSTDGAMTYNPLTLAIVGDSMPGHPYVGHVAPGQAVRIMTGAPIPAQCDAVVPAEFADADAAGAYVDVLAAVPPEKNVGRRGEDVLAGTRLFEAGRLLRPQDLRRDQLGRPRHGHRPAPPAGAAGGHRQRTAAERDGSARLLHRRRQRADALRSRDEGRRDCRLSRHRA